MVAVAFLLIWSGYGMGLWGWCLIRDYDVTLPQLLSPARPYSGPWPPAKIPSSQTWPSVTAAATPASTTAAPKAATAQPVPDATGLFPTVAPGGKITPGKA